MPQSDKNATRYYTAYDKKKEINKNNLDDVVFIRDGRVLLTDTVENIREVKGKSVDQYFREVFAC